MGGAIAPATISFLAEAPMEFSEVLFMDLSGNRPDNNFILVGIPSKLSCGIYTAGFGDDCPIFIEH